MRGKRTKKLEAAEKNRNIPAYAGKTVGLRTYRERSPEHPRVCGENVVTAVGALTAGGTSPRMRGKLGWSGG